jgi:hypothetical protein
MIIVPNTLKYAIHVKIDEQMIPELEDSREEIYQQLLEYYNKWGAIPRFRLEKS